MYVYIVVYNMTLACFRALCRLEFNVKSTTISRRLRIARQTLSTCKRWVMFFIFLDSRSCAYVYTCLHRYGVESIVNPPEVCPHWWPSNW